MKNGHYSQGDATSLPEICLPYLLSPLVISKNTMSLRASTAFCLLEFLKINKYARVNRYIRSCIVWKDALAFYHLFFLWSKILGPGGVFHI